MQNHLVSGAAAPESLLYDSRDRLQTKACPQGTLTYGYDEAGNLTGVGSSHGTNVSYSYDVLNRAATAVDGAVGTTTYAFDSVGNLAESVYPNGVKHGYTYTVSNKLTNVSVMKGTTALAGYTYTLSTGGVRTAVSELSGRSVSYSYDNLFRLTGETIAGAANPAANGTVGYSYDAVGNRLSRTSTIAAIPAQTNTLDANDRLASDTYDDNGNTIGSDGTAYEYDSENRIRRVTKPNGTVIVITYNGDGDRVMKDVDGVVTQYHVDRNNLTGYAQVIEELDGGASVTRKYSFGLDLIAQTQNGTVSFFDYDGHGSVRQLSDAAGNVTDTFGYDAFGILIERTGSTPNRYMYAGEQWDQDLGFYVLRARYMNPRTGRFWTMDELEAGPFSDPQSLHKYLYCGGNPVNRFDPSGNFSLLEVNWATGIISLLASFGPVQAGQSMIEDLGYGYEFGSVMLATAIVSIIGSTVSSAAKAASGVGSSAGNAAGQVGRKLNPTNPGGVSAGENCIACVAAFLKNVASKARTKADFYSADDIVSEFGAVTDASGRAIKELYQAKDYLAKTGVKLEPTYRGWNDIVRAGDYVLMSADHTLIGRVLPTGRKVLFNVQTNAILAEEEVHSMWGAMNVYFVAP